MDGYYAETLASEFLKQHGYSLLERNYRCSWGEIDIIARKNNTCVFIEVRYRRQDTYGSGLESVTRAKQAKLIAAANMYLYQKSPDFDEYRFDVISLAKDHNGQLQFEWIQDAFEC